MVKDRANLRSLPLFNKELFPVDFVALEEKVQSAQVLQDQALESLHCDSPGKIRVQTNVSSTKKAAVLPLQPPQGQAKKAGNK